MPPSPASLSEIQFALEGSVRKAEKSLKSMTDERAQASCQLSFGDKPIFTKPRESVMRSIMLNHCYHHRGQLSASLRSLEVPVPVRPKTRLVEQRNAARFKFPPRSSVASVVMGVFSNHGGARDAEATECPS